MASDRNDRIKSVRWLAILAATTARARASARAGSAKAWYWAARSATFLGGAGMTVAMNLPYMFKNTSGTSASTRVCSAWVETWTLPKHDDLADRHDRHALDLLSLERDDQVLAAPADVRALLLDVEHGLVVVVRDHARQGDGRWVAARAGRPRLRRSACG